MNGLRILLFVAIASPLLALWPRDQDPAAIDWTSDVERACTSPRYGLRLAASRKVAKAGAAAVPAILAFAAKKGPNEVPAALVDAIADAATVEAAVLDLLRHWAQTKDFFWRAGAMRGLALRAPRLPERRDELAAMFTAHHDDPAWLTRVHARFGTVLLGDEAPLRLPETDPRARVRLTTLVLAQGRVPPLQPLLDALADERTFQGDPWGKRVADEAHKALKTWLGDAHPLAAGGSFPDLATGLQQLLAACRTKSGQQLSPPVHRVDPAIAFAGGIEIWSCQHGDLFLQWTADGAVHFGIDSSTVVRIADAAWAELCKDRTALPLTANAGVVVCDVMRVRVVEPAMHVRIAPASSPPPLTGWLQRLAGAIDEAGEPRLAAALRTGGGQFAER